ncbi:hypothetical protein ACRWQL_12820 [Shewanella sp. HL-SH4]|uniref:hypothetical protein n=1 Tax=Shewanella sp. HL-SH4 TaxID=3436240 RepID=UPI003EBD67F2
MPYQSAVDGGTGYRSFEPIAHCHDIKFQAGGGWYDTDILAKYWHRRASELCPQGYEYNELSIYSKTGSFKMQIGGASNDIASPSHYITGIAMCLSASSRLVGTEYPVDKTSMLGTKIGQILYPMCTSKKSDDSIKKWLGEQSIIEIPAFLENDKKI